MADKILIDIMDARNRDAGTKARNDVTHILNDMGFETIVMFNRTHHNVVRLFQVLRATWRMRKSMGQGELIVLQYPYQPQIMHLMIRQINTLRKKYGCRFVILIHDVVYLRGERGSLGDLEAMKRLEVGFFNAANAVIVHNSVMARELREAGVSSPMYELGLFDYIYDGKSARIPHSFVPIVVFAGNLSPEKSGFIYQQLFFTRVRFHLYGTQQGDLPSCFSYQGSFPPDELIASIEGHYGLVWDGSSAQTCTGNYGNYLRYNNPHKLSLYLAAGLPVVVWKESALADFVQDNGLGVVIDALSELDNLPTPDSKEYQCMQSHVEAFRDKLCAGEMLKQAIKNIVAKKNPSNIIN